MYKQKDDGASDIIAFILILFIVVVAVAMWMLVIIPSQGTEAENDHNDKVLMEFADFKEGIDQLWLNNLAGYSNSHMISLAPSERTSLSTLMYLAPTLGSGSLKIEKGTKITLYDTYRLRKNVDGKVTWSTYPCDTDGENINSDLSSGKKYEFYLLRITFTTDNVYAPNYTILYEGGAVWYADAEGNTYQLLSPVVDPEKSNKKNYYLIATDVSNPGNVNTTLTLGNLPVVLTYTYLGKLKTTYSDYHVDGSGDVIVPRQRNYLEFYNPEVEEHTHDDDKGNDLRSDNEKALDQDLKKYWEEYLNAAKAVSFDNSSPSDSNLGAFLSVLQYDVSLADDVSLEGLDAEE